VGSPLLAVAAVGTDQPFAVAAGDTLLLFDMCAVDIADVPYYYYYYYLRLHAPEHLWMSIELLAALAAVPLLLRLVGPSGRFSIV
jgi:hypothetical protein